jgi:hypothetical protein
MTEFLLATFAAQPPVGTTVAAPLTAALGPAIALEILRDGDEWAVLVSSADDAKAPTRLTCLIGFANAAKSCSRWLDRGFPLVDATVTLDDHRRLSVVAPFFAAPPRMEYEEQLLCITGVPATLSPGQSAGAKDGVLGSLSYQQHQQTPDSSSADALVRRRSVRWTPQRSHVSQLAASAAANIRIIPSAVARFPSLQSFTVPAAPVAVWTGELTVPTEPTERGPVSDPEKASLGFGAPAFRFEDVEILGFRLDLRDLGTNVTQGLAELVKPLNFHLAARAARGDTSTAIPDFRYEAATGTVMIELLRYGRMTALDPLPPLGLEDSQSQHELVVRLLVGKVDDDSAQAREPAVFVPAIFVDNSWSKMLGRDAVGFDKRMAAFHVMREKGPRRLRPDGCLAAGGAPDRTSEPLSDVHQVTLVNQIGGTDGPPLLSLSYTSGAVKSPRDLLPIDLDLIFGTSTLSGTRWRQTDFNLREFRRAFARLAISESARTFHGIQVAPVGSRPFDWAWITSRYTIDADIRADLPGGNATLRLFPVAGTGSASSTPRAWNTLCSILESAGPIVLGQGSWYHLVCSMTLALEDGLDWSD